MGTECSPYLVGDGQECVGFAPGQWEAGLGLPPMEAETVRLLRLKNTFIFIYVGCAGSVLLCTGFVWLQ